MLPSDSQPPAPPPTETVWPPPPQGKGREPGSVVIDRVEVMQTPDQLTLRNRRARYHLVFGCCCLPLSLALLHLLDFLISPHRLGSPHTLWDYVASVYRRSGQRLLYQDLGEWAAFGVFAWFLYDRLFHRGLFVLDRRGGTVQAGGGTFCLLAQLEYVLIRRAAGNCVIYLMRVDEDASLAWVAHGWPRVPRNACFVAQFRQEASAEDVAGIIAEFAGVTVRQSPS